MFVVVWFLYCVLMLVEVQEVVAVEVQVLQVVVVKVVSEALLVVWVYSLVG